ncbi:MAG: DUF481 domain-containing protein [Verrucomicrobiae bacterium]|nr:DUF481 domain-containing protein [Verrucomicrobiae bacterium]
MSWRKLRICLFALLGCFGAVWVCAQQPVATNAEPKKGKWESEVALGLTLTSGNRETWLLTGDARTQRKKPPTEWSFGLNASYGETEDVKSTELLRGYGQGNRLWGEYWFLYARGDGLHNDITGVDYRFAVGPGLGRYLLKRSRTSLSVEAGATFVWERVSSAANDYVAVRFAERFEHKFNDRARVWHSVEWLPAVDDWSDYVLTAEAGVDSALSKLLSMRVYVQDIYDSEPALGRKPNDLRLVSALVVKF